MNAANLPTFREMVTLLNRLDSQDSPDRLDHWKKTVLRQCFWSGQRTRSQSSRLSTAVEVNEGASYLVRIPASPDYRPYHVWREDMEGFALSPGDFLILGEVEEEVTAETVQAVVDRHRPDAFEIQLVKVNTSAGFLEHYRVEGQ